MKNKTEDGKEIFRKVRFCRTKWWYLIYESLKNSEIKHSNIWNNKWFNVNLTFYGISKIENSEKKERFSIGLDANLNKGEFHAIRLDEQTFLIPKKFNTWISQGDK